MSPDPTPRRTVIIATKNRGKLAEMRRLLQPVTDRRDVQLLGLDDVADVHAPDETGATFMENAAIKARYYADSLGAIAIADDSGLVVDALNGEPGVRSARYGSDETLDDAGRTRLLLANLDGVPDVERTARFVCAVCVCAPGLTDADAEPLLSAEGVVEGRIVTGPRGRNGFGYDPVFVPDGYQQTAAEMSAQDKDAVSHRGRAIRGMMADLWEVLG